MSIAPFSVSRLPRIVFGEGRLQDIPQLATGYGPRVLLVRGRQAVCGSPQWPPLIEALERQGANIHQTVVEDEPSPKLVDETVAAFRHEGIDVVVGIGGGSVLDAAKAIAGLLPSGRSVMDHLEGVGRDIPYQGPATPLILAPTTAGTGSEATKNAVLSVRGTEGFKKSFRDEALVAEYAVVDPELLASCPPALIAANGMDALTQLMESYVSSRANPMIDALALSGVAAIKGGFFAAWEGGDSDTARAGRSAMAYAATLSGITLAQVGLGSVHGLASPLGAFFPIPHGVVCGTLLAAATEVNIRSLTDREPDNPALEKYAHLGRLLSDQPEADRDTALDQLVQTLSDWVQRMDIPRLGDYDISEADFGRIVANSRGSSMRTNPIVLEDHEIRQILEARL